MISIPKVAIIALAVIGLGALQFAVPALTNKTAYSDTSNNTLAAAINTANLKNLLVGDSAEVTRGTLYFTVDNPNASNQTPQTFISPLLKTQVDIQVTGIIARTRLTQTFKNASEDWVNAEYVFPLPENSAVDHLLITVGERKIEGQIKEKQLAQKIYNDAKKAGKKASLVAQHRPNMFSNSIANIAPGESIEISIEYQQRLAIDKQTYSLRFPMTITPRYSPQENQTTELAATPIFTEPTSSADKDEIDLTVNLKSGFEVQQLTSEFHPIKDKRLSDGSHHIQLTGDKVANQDFVLTWQAELGAVPSTSHFSQNVNGHQYGLIMLFPPATSQLTDVTKQQAREVIFVLDTSGSMEGESIAQAKQALILGINQLTEKDTFNLIEFNNQAQNLWQQPKHANANNKQQAITFISELRANGGTEMFSALDLALSATTSTSAEKPSSTILRQVIFITDGSVSNEESLMQKITNDLADSRLFTVGIGSAPNSYFMTEAAKMGKGTFTYIGSTDQVQQKMQVLFTKLEHPALTDINLQLPVKANMQNLEIYPNVIGDLYHGEPLILSYKLNMPSSDKEKFQDISLSAQYQGNAWQTDLTLTAITRQAGLNVLWAREKIAQLSRDKRRARMTPQHSELADKEYQQLITQTALNHHLVSQYTSLVAVDVTPSKPENIKSKNRKVANNLPAGTKNKPKMYIGSLPKTATNAQLNIIIGLILIGLSICMHLLTKRKVKFQQH
ncbi:marine proteobacterial sortase target protein [Paraglaciecola sp. L3A3]|uniref:marine proteobacterial sortase target protein n=1 Tax=Paraglaciecola sp. L3A3 TaxID=2686358 RepID=UPI00131BAC3B|nr:marine proteobacterial sortase target protein [Paraglaciecola sp. L3A3]